MINLFHRKNEIAIDLTGVVNPRVIDISYKGIMQAESMLPSRWTLTSNKNRILCLSLSGQSEDVELLMRYSGLIQIIGVTVIDQDLQRHAGLVTIEDIDTWDYMTVDFDKNTQYWEGLFSTHTKERSLTVTDIVKNNLLTNSGEFYFINGTPYEGEYHQHGDGQAMTGAKHTADSEFIYKKDLNQNIIDIRKNINKREVLEIMSQAPAFIPTIRRYTKSNLDKVKDSASINAADVRGMIKDITEDFIYNQSRTLAQINVMGVDKSNELKATLEEASTTWKPIKGGPIKDRPKGYDKSLGEFVDIDISEFSAEVKKKEKDY